MEEDGGEGRGEQVGETVSPPPLLLAELQNRNGTQITFQNKSTHLRIIL